MSDDEDAAVLLAAGRRARSNRMEIAASDVCGCFYCLSMFRSVEIEAWLGAGGEAAVCPRCGVDAVIGSASGYPLSRAALARLYGYWFASC